MVVVRRGGRDEVYEGDIVAVAAGAANSAAILLRSPSDRHPEGLANGSGQVGRNYMYHNSKAVVALGKERNDTVFEKTLGLNDFYFAGDGREWPLGNIQMCGKSNAEAMKGEEPKLTKLAPHWSLADVARHAVDFWLTTEDVPKPDNRVTVDHDGRVHLAYAPTNAAEANGLYQELRKILNHIGMAEHHVLDKNFYMSMSIPIAGVAHQAGTCRFGNDPARSVLDANCKAPRTGQPLRRRHQLLPQHRSGEPGPHRDGQRHPGRRAPAQPDVVKPLHPPPGVSGGGGGGGPAGWPRAATRPGTGSRSGRAPSALYGR